MTSILKKVFSSSSAIVKNLFPSQEERHKKKLMKAGNKFYRGIVACLDKRKQESESAYSKLLHRRLNQYQRMRRHGSRQAKTEALRKLQKEWKKFVKTCERKNATGKIIPISSEQRK